MRLATRRIGPNNRKLNHLRSQLQPRLRRGHVCPSLPQVIASQQSKWGIKLEDAISDFIDDCRTANLSVNTVDSYEVGLQSLRTYLNKNAAVEEITSNDLRSFLSMLDDQGYASKSIKNRRQNITRFFNWMEEQGFIETNPAARLPKIKVGKKHLLPHTLDEVQKMLDVIDTSTEVGHRNALLLLLLCDTGARVSEILNIKIGNIQMSESRILVTGKGNKDRYILLHPRVKTLLRNYFRKYVGDEKDDDSYLFESERCPGEPLTRQGAYKIIHKLGVQVGVTNAYPHRLRRTQASYMYSEGADVLMIQQELGHADPSTTSIYISAYAPDAKRKHEKYSPINKLKIRTRRKLGNWKA